MWVLSSGSLRRPFLVSAIFLAAAFVFTPFALASTLSIRIDTTMEVTGERLRAKIRYTNNGTATAGSAQAHLTLLGESFSGSVTERLGPGETDVAEFELLLEGTSGSRYPFIVYVDFKDGNNYPFSALSCGTVSFGGEVPGGIECEGSDTGLSDHGNVDFVVTNNGDATVEISAGLVLPREFVSSGTIRKIGLDPGATTSFHFKVNNSTALPGASYPVFCVVEYQLDGRHGSAVGTAMVTVEASDTLFRRFRPAVTAVFVFTGLLLIWISALGAYRRLTGGSRESRRGHEPDADYL